MSRLLYALALPALMSACTDGVPVADQAVEPGAAFVGSSACSDCHRQQYEDWLGSHHQLAMQEATSETVLGEFANNELVYNGAATTFFKRGDTFVARTADAGGEPGEFTITHTFGVSPLQQYLVDVGNGRKQALPFAWDTRPPEAGGQRWYDLYPDDIVGPGDPLHWTGRYYNWNYMCAECHSTNVRMGYDVASDSFDTRFDEISVGCEACHGPGSTHVRQAESAAFDDAWGLSVSLDDRRDSSWSMNPDTGIAERSSPPGPLRQPEACGRCHSRRGVIAPDYEYGKPLLDTHRVSLLEQNLYFADGRIKDEVYVYGSFVQSRMYAAGVSCSDCHNPHSGELHAGPNPNDTCAQCHLPTVFATAGHSSSDTGNCVGCHMPATTYMGVDDRRDHSFRLPQTADDPNHYGAVIAAGRRGNANPELIAAIGHGGFPAIARATMLTLLRPDANGSAAALAASQVDDPDPLVRAAAARALHALHGDPLQASRLLRDPIRAVRLEAAEMLVDYRDLLPIDDARAFTSAADEYRHAMRALASRPDAALNLAEFESRMGNLDDALRMYQHAIRVGPDYAPAYHSYGLRLVRDGDADTALDYLRRAAELAPENSRFVYVYGVALNSLGLSNEAITVLENARTRFASDFDIAWALATIYRDRGDLAAARRIGRELSGLYPGDARVATFLRSIGS